MARDIYPGQSRADLKRSSVCSLISREIWNAVKGWKASELGLVILVACSHFEQLQDLGSETCGPVLICSGVSVPLAHALACLKCKHWFLLGHPYSVVRIVSSKISPHELRALELGL